MVKKGSTIVLVLFIFTIIFSFLSAQSNWNVAPMTVELNADAGDTLTKLLNVYNKADFEQTFTVYWKDWNYNADGSMPEFDPGSLKRGCAGWLTVTPQTFTIPPKSSQTIRYTLSVPDTVSSGNYWGAIFFQTIEKPTLASKMESERGGSYSVFIQFRSKVSLNVTVNGDIIHDGVITDITINLPVENTPLTVFSTFLNTGNMRLTCKGSIELRDEMGEPLETLSMEGFSVFPDGERIIKTSKEIILDPGEYSAMVIIDFGGDYLVAGDAFFEVP